MIRRPFRPPFLESFSGMTAAINYCAGIWEKRYFWMSLVHVDLRRRYRRSMFGIGWSLMHPVAMTAVFCLVFCAMPQWAEPLATYAPYVLSGLVFWSFVTGTTTDGCQCFYLGENYIRQQPMPLAIYPLRATLGVATHLLLGMVMLLLMVWVVQGPKNLLYLWSVVPALAIIFALAWSVAICLGVMNVIFPDTQHLVQLAMQAAFYTTPVFYRPTMLPERLRWLSNWNPLAACLELIRAPVLDAQLASWNAWGLAIAATCLAATAAVFTLSKVEKRLVFSL